MQRVTLVDWFRDFGREDDSPYPNRRMHTRVRLDSEAVIFEAVVNEDWLDNDFISAKLADIFDVDPVTITVVVSQNIYGTMGDFQRPAGTSRMRLGIFGGTNATVEESRSSCVAYLITYNELWENEP